MNNRFAILSLAVLAAACSAAEPETLTPIGNESEALDIGPVTEGPLIFDFCGTVEPNQVFYVGSNSGTLASPSLSGAYGYAVPCGRWIVDYKVATYSPTWEIYGEPWDLPSSSAAKGTMPSTAHDCGRLSIYVTFYRKKSNETAFTKLGGARLGGYWNGTCSRTLLSGSMTAALAPPSQAGWDTYRIAVATRLRSSWQETRAVGRQYIEPPS
jgi:hypothetical protein